jgi:hypothetical protein
MNRKRVRPSITLLNGQTPKAVDEAERIFARDVERLLVFHRGGEVVRIIAPKKATRSELLARPRGTVLLVPLPPPALVELFEREAKWLKMTKAGDPYCVNCPLRVATSYLSRVGQWKVPELRGFIEAPVVLPGGVVVRRRGFDLRTGLYLTEDWPDNTRKSTLKDAQAALARLLEPFNEFPLVGPEDRAVLVAGILTALQRRILPSAPLFGFTAPVQRTGKSLLAESIAIIATGREAPAMAVSTEQGEMRKAVLACLREGHLIVNLDNIEEPLESPDLSRAITQSIYADRVLGESRVLHLPTNVLWTATGNNLTLRGDLTVRTLLCRLDSGVERPESRRFSIKNLKAHLVKYRRELVAAGVTILQAYEVAGRPDLGLEPWGGFDDWSASVRSAVVWAGGHDACETRKYVREDDPELEDAASLLVAWRTHFGDSPATLAKVILESAADAILRDALTSVCGAPKGHDSRKLAWWCRHWQGRVAGGLKLLKSGSYGHAVEWTVRDLSGVNSGLHGVSGDISGGAKNESSNFESAGKDSCDSKVKPNPDAGPSLADDGLLGEARAIS